jgi:hypothetical protein
MQAIRAAAHLFVLTDQLLLARTGIEISRVTSADYGDHRLGGDAGV